MPRLTSHGEVVFESKSNGRLHHNFWQDYRDWWPGEAKPDVGNGGCGTCGNGQPAQPPAPPKYASMQAWYDDVAGKPCDFHEHMPTLRALVPADGVAVELSFWLKPALIALATAMPKVLVSVCPGVKPEWAQIKQFVPGMTPVQADPLVVEPVASDVLFIDTAHTAARLHAELTRWAPLCRRYVVVHCTDPGTFGEKGDDGGPDDYGCCVTRGGTVCVRRSSGGCCIVISDYTAEKIVGIGGMLTCGESSASVPVEIDTVVSN